MMTKERHPFQPQYAVAPGETLKETLEHVGMSQAELALRTDLSEKHVSELANAKAPITADTASRLETVLGIPASFWMNMEAFYQQQKLKLAQKSALMREAERVGEFPYAKLAEHGFVPEATDRLERVSHLLAFFGVTSFDRLPSVYAAAYRTARGRDPDEGALLAWLRMGEVMAQDVETAAYDEAVLRARIPELRGLTLLAPREAGDRLREIMAESGVRLVYTPHLPKTYAHGATRWITGRPLIQLSVRYKWEDIFWFSLFHEIGHIVRKHSRKEVLINWHDKGRKDETEREADQYAANTLIPPLKHQGFVAGGEFSAARVRGFAERIGICPGIVVGRLQHDGQLPRSHLNGLRRKLEIVTEG